MGKHFRGSNLLLLSFSHKHTHTCTRTRTHTPCTHEIPGRNYQDPIELKVCFSVRFFFAKKQNSNDNHLSSMFISQNWKTVKKSCLALAEKRFIQFMFFSSGGSNNTAVSQENSMENYCSLQ